MEQHGLFQNNQAAWTRYPTFRQEVGEILGADRLSAMKEQQIRKFRLAHENVKFLNEDTLLQNLLPIVVMDEYTVEEELGANNRRQDLDHSAQAPTDMALHNESPDKRTYTTRLWADDGLVITMNSEFRDTLLPNQYTAMGFEAELAKALAKNEGMKNPKPDYCYGLAPKTLPFPRGIILGGEPELALNIAKGLIHPFLIVEGKSDQGEAGQAQNQACRGGATLVNATRILYEKVVEPEIDGPDSRSIVFSVVMAPAVLSIFVHWAEVADGCVTYHMHRLATRCLEEDDQLRELRRMLHNILNWGCNTKRRDWEVLHEKIYSMQRAETRKILEDSRQLKRRRLD